MSDNIELRRKIERAVTDYLLSRGAFVDGFCIEVAPDFYGHAVAKPHECTTIALDRLAEAVAEELAHERAAT